MSKGVEFVGEVAEAGIPSLVFGGDGGSVGCAHGGGTLAAVIGGGRHEDWAAGDDVSDDFCSIIGGVDDVRSFEIVGDHAADFSAGAEANYAADGGVGVTEWIMPVDGTVG